MVGIKMKNKRKAIAMIELIVAIVIMGIVFLSIPMINREAVRGGESAIMQESIAAAASQIQLVLSRHWDEVVANTGVIAQTQSDNFKTLAGVNPASRMTLDGSSNTQDSSAIGTDKLNDTNDIDDFNSTTMHLSIYNAEGTKASVGDYIDTNITMTTKVSYGSDDITLGQATTHNNPFTTTKNTTTNIKLVSVNLTSGGTGVESIDDKNITLSAFSCNIGTTRPSTTGDN